MKHLIYLVGCKQPYFGTSFVAGGNFVLNICNGGTKKFLYILLLILPFSCFSQHGRNNVWVMGYNSPPLSLPMQINFYGNSLNQNILNRSINFKRTASCIANNQGNLLFYTNGIVMGNKLNDTMQNSQGFNPGYLTNSQSDGLNMQQNCLIIPFPNDSNKYYVFHESCEIINWGSYYYPLHLSYSVVDMSLDNSLGAVTDKSMVVINDTLDYGLLTAVKHANGRDWWIIVPAPNVDFIYTLLVTPTDIQGPFQARTNGVLWGKRGFSGSSIFSPDGSKYARYNRDNHLCIFDFNRCDGTFSNLVNIYPFPNFNLIGYLAFSANSQYLYVNIDSFLVQYDVFAPNIDVSKVSIFDATIAPMVQGVGMGNLAPDGKIYFTGSNSTTMNMIHAPDFAGLACNFEFNAVDLGYYNYSSMPHHPNYALGPLIGSKCDTLTSIKEEGIRKEVSIYPNPATDKLYISIAGIKEPLTILMLNTLGQEVARYALAQEEQEISLANLPKGVYYCRVMGREGVYFAAKVIKE